MRSLAEPAVAFILQSAIVAGLALFAGRALARRGAAFRVAIYRAGVLSILVLTLAGPAIRLIARPVWQIGGSANSRLAPLPIASDAVNAVTPLVPTSQARAARTTPNGKAVARAEFTGAGASPSEPATTQAKPSPRAAPARPISMVDLFALTLAGGTAVLLGAVVFGAIGVRRMYCGARRVPATVLSAPQRRGSAPVLISPRIQSACAAGVFRPAIFLPERAESAFSPDQLEAIVCHEQIHIRRSDCLWTVLTRIACAIAWLNPLLWILAHRLTLSAEELCDQLVLAEGIEPACYADCLLKIAGSRLRRPSLSLAALTAVGVVTSRSHLAKRISLMLNDRLTPSPTFSRTSGLLVTAIAALVGLGACVAVSASPLSAFRQESTPESTVRAFYKAINAGDWKGVFSPIEGADVDGVMEYISKHPELNHKAQPVLLKIQSSEIAGDDAVVHLVPNFVGPAPVHGMSELQIHLHRSGDVWKLVSGTGDRNVVGDLLEVSRDPARLTKMLAAQDKTRILSNMKQIALAVIMFSSDQSDVLQLSQSTLKEKLGKYLAQVGKYYRVSNVWLDPDGKPLDVRFNAELTGKSLTQFEDTSHLAMLTLGPRGNLKFYGNATPIGFADGHVKFMNRDDLKRVLWK